MSAVDLLQPILDGGLQRNNFFNGRLLSAEDLRAEQNANRTQHRHLSRALGDGVAWGLGVSVKTIGGGSPTVAVTAGLALNRLGDIVYLPDEAEVALVPEETAAEVAEGMFVECEPPRATGSLTGEGAYVLVISPTSGYSGTALVSDPNTTSAGRGACGARFNVEGVRFRLVPVPLAALTDTSSVIRSRITGLLPPPTGNVPARERLRNLIAHLCFGTEDLRSYFTDPLSRVSGARAWTGWGALDAMRSRGDITKCDVPLAIIVLTGTGISFVDMWPVRRRLLDAAAIDTWRGVAGPRRVAEAEAAFLQFQSQLEIVRGVASPGSIAASTYFDALPAAGWLPTGTGAFNWSTFLGVHAPPSVTPVDAALLRGIIERSWCDEPFTLFGSNPPVPLRVYQVPGESFVVFARSENGNVRVFLTPSPTSAESVVVTATGRNGQAVRSVTRTGSTVPVTDIAPGTHSITVVAPDYVAVAPRDVDVVGGRTTDVTIAITPMPNGSILVNAIDENTTLSLGSRVSSITATSVPGGQTRSAVFVPSSGRWLIADLPAGSYALSGVASGYEVATSGAVGPVVRGVQTAAVLIFEPVTVPPRAQPSKCVTVNEARQPPLGRIKLCMVLTATEFDAVYYYGEVPEKAFRENAASGTYATTNRKKAAKKRAATRTTSKSGEILYSESPWLGMQPLEPETDDVRKWLLDWREWFAHDLDDKSIQESNPVVYVDPRYRPPTSTSQVRTTPPAYAVFGRFAVPLLIKVDSGTTHAPVPIDPGYVRGLPLGTIEELFDAEIYYIDDLAFAWGDLVQDIIDEVINPVKQLIVDAGQAVTVINETRNYYEGVDAEVNNILTQAGILDDVALANADIAELGELLGSVGFATRLVEQARDIVPASSWSLTSVGIAPEQAAALGEQGIDSLGSLAAHIGEAESNALIGDALGLDTSAEGLDTAITAIANEAVQIMTEHSVTLLPVMSIVSMESLDTVTANKLGEGGFVTVDALAAADAEEVAAVANVSVETARGIVANAQNTSKGGRGISVLAPVSTAEANSINATFGGNVTLSGLAAMTAPELAVALGGDEARAGAIINGVTAGMAGGMLRH